MPRSTKKTIVFARHASGKGHTTYPVSVHASERSARAFRDKIAATHKTGDVEATKALSPVIRVDEAGALFPDTRWALVTVPYEPEAGTDAVTPDDFEL